MFIFLAAKIVMLWHSTVCNILEDKLRGGKKETSNQQSKENILAFI